jgi:hypothetical protein
MIEEGSAKYLAPGALSQCTRLTKRKKRCRQLDEEAEGDVTVVKGKRRHIMDSDDEEGPTPTKKQWVPSDPSENGRGKGEETQVVPWKHMQVSRLIERSSPEEYKKLMQVVVDNNMSIIKNRNSITNERNVHVRMGASERQQQLEANKKMAELEFAKVKARNEMDERIAQREEERKQEIADAQALVELERLKGQLQEQQRAKRAAIYQAIGDHIKGYLSSSGMDRIAIEEAVIDLHMELGRFARRDSATRSVRALLRRLTTESAGIHRYIAGSL